MKFDTKFYYTVKIQKVFANLREKLLLAVLSLSISSGTPTNHISDHMKFQENRGEIFPGIFLRIISYTIK